MLAQLHYSALLLHECPGRNKYFGYSTSVVQHNPGQTKSRQFGIATNTRSSPHASQTKKNSN